MARRAQRRLAGGVSHRNRCKSGRAPEGRKNLPNTMSSTHTSLHYHINLSIKDRVPAMVVSWRERLHAYMGGVVRNIDGVAETIGGVADHVHLLISLNANHCLADAVRDVKSVSSRWVHEEIGLRNFAWQEGYGAFTVSPSQRGKITEYINQQEKHHRRRTFQQEYVTLLEKSGIEFEEKYLW